MKEMCRLKLRVKFLRSDKDGWDYLKGPAETLTVPEDIVASDLSVLIRDSFGIPEGRSYAFYMTNTVRPSPYQYSDLVEDGYLDGGKTTLKQALQGPKFKFEYSFSDGLIFQCEVKD